MSLKKGQRDILDLSDCPKIFTPCVYNERHLSPVEHALLDLPPTLRMHPLKFVYRRLQGYLEKPTADGRFKLDDNAGPVDITDPLAFLRVARWHFRMVADEVFQDFAMHHEMERLLTILMCALPLSAGF